MSIQDTPFSSPPQGSTASDRNLGQSSTGGGAGTAQPSDLRSTADAASRDFAALKEQASSELANVTSQAADHLQTFKAQAQGQLGEVTEKAKSYATEQVSQLTDRARSFADERKQTAAEQLHGVVDAASRIAEDLRNHEQGKVVAPYAETVVSGLRQLADTVERRSVDDLFSMVGDFGRRQPVAFLGVAALAGFAASRFLMASSRRREGMDANAGMDAGMMGSAGAYGDTMGSTASSGFDATGATEFGGTGTFDVAVEDDRLNKTNPAGSSYTGTSDNGRI